MSESRRIVIAGTGSGAGKTTVTIGLMAALKRKGYIVQGFKCGPDYIDPTYHTAVTGRASRNLDSYMLSHDTVKEIFVRGSAGADISIIEGVMGMYDGKEATSDKGSTAEISILTGSPVLLVVNCQSMARSAAAIVKGFQLLNPAARIVGVIANKVGSEGHHKIVKTAIEQECGIPVVGYLKRENELEIPERHLGLVPSVERGELTPLFDKLADLIGDTVDLELIWELAKAETLQAEAKLFAVTGTPERVTGTQPRVTGTQKRVTIAVAKDPAFHFYYPENLELLEVYGAKLLFFSPLAGETVPAEADGLYIGGGFPEEFASELSQNQKVLESFRAAILSGLPTLAECGGFMFLTEAIVTTEGDSYPMVGLIPGKVTMQKKLAALGYREVRGKEGNFLLGTEEQAKGHEFHYSTYATDAELPHAYETKGLRGTNPEGYASENLVAGYTHLHFGSNPELVKRWILRCVEVGARA
ncbi:cobyrinate a,c-diamide synthase [Brevibacillus choshinensis]|uniref:cobyrinate a,c-diamide synthase n=1 Tax=Brevibacillus choshinensis TaxID=54911 RepID=UPI002E1CD69F|nr:cobyrinate a,c-diamide synthase [Brevibacillus choshinensis]MED4782194.1 cobyrinate a,c-diamide synthase [Brevibacillus choshinensis]